MWCAPHIEGQYLRDEITRIVIAAGKAYHPNLTDWFNEVYALLETHEISKDQRAQFYTHAKGVEDARKRRNELQSDGLPS